MAGVPCLNRLSEKFNGCQPQYVVSGLFWDIRKQAIGALQII